MKKILLVLLCLNSAYATQVDWDVVFKPSYIVSSRELSSFFYNNSTAPTNASRNSSSSDTDMRSSFQFMQSNFGVKLTDDKIKLTSRFDFVDFEKASPSFQLNPRAIELFLEYEHIRAGLQKDLFSPLSPKTFNLVAGNFFAGDVGYFRNQAIINFKNQAVSIGQIKPNVSAVENYYSEIKTGLLFQYLYQVSKDSRKYGVSLSYANFHHYGEADVVDDSSGINLFYEGGIYKSHFLKTEVYYGYNLQNAGYFALSDPSTERDLYEVGGYVEYEYLSRGNDSLVIGYSKAEVDKKVNQRIYIERFDEIQSKGLISNEKVYTSYWKEIEKDFFLVSELSHFNTMITYADYDVDTQKAVVFEFGAALKFN